MSTKVLELHVLIFASIALILLVLFRPYQRALVRWAKYRARKKYEREHTRHTDS